MRKFRTLHGTLALIASLAIVIAAMSAGTSAQTQPVRIGATLPLTGPFADTGLWVERGYRAWATEINGRGGLLGRRVELIILDDASSPDRAVSLLERLITVVRVELVLGGYPGTSAAAQMGLAERYRKVYVSMGGHMASFSRGFRYSFGAPPLMGQWWYEGVWDWIASMPAADRPQRAAIITVNNPVGASVLESSIDGLRRLGIPVVLNERYDLPLASADPLVSRARAANADLFISNSFFPDGVLTVRAMKALDYSPKLFLQGIGSIIPEWVAELGADGNNVVSGTPIHDRLPFPGIAELNQRVRRDYNVTETPQYYLFGYAWAQALEKAVTGAQSFDQDTLAPYLRGNEIETIAGTMRFDGRGLPSPISYVTQVQDGRVQLIWPPDVATASPIYPRPAWR